MTIIAAMTGPKACMISDSRTTCGGVIVPDHQKIHLVGDCLVGFAGPLGEETIFYQWLLHSADLLNPPPGDHEKFNALVLKSNNELWEFYGYKPHLTDGVAFIGSGYKQAQAYFDIEFPVNNYSTVAKKKLLKESVQFAIDTEVSCGGPIHMYDFEKLPPKPPWFNAHLHFKIKETT